jgi:hypothetical protein
MAKNIVEQAARAVAIASDAETAARASIGQEPFVQDKHRKIARAVIEALREPTPQMINAALAWQQHCSDVDSLFQEMIQAALHPEDYPATPHPLCA